MIYRDGFIELNGWRGEIKDANVRVPKWVWFDVPWSPGFITAQFWLPDGKVASGEVKWRLVAEGDDYRDYEMALHATSEPVEPLFPCPYVPETPELHRERAEARARLGL